MMKLLLLLLFLGSLLPAAPAFHGYLELRDTNNEPFYAHLKGDEYLNWFESSASEILLFNKERQRYEYAVVKDDKLVPSGIAKKAHTKTRALQPISHKTLQRLWRQARSHERQRRQESP